MLVISPHLDDAVFGCGRLIAAHPGSVVVTVFAGVPRDPERLTEWDAACGFRSAAEAVATRRREDQAALALLDATPRWLDFCDSQYDETPALSELAAALGQVDTQLRLFGKPRVEGHRRVAVTLALGQDVDDARAKAREAAAQLQVELR